MPVGRYSRPPADVARRPRAPRFRRAYQNGLFDGDRPSTRHMRLLRLVAAVALILAVVAGAGAGVAVADHDTGNDQCSGLHTADERSDGTAGADRVDHNHQECHGNVGA